MEASPFAVLPAELRNNIWGHASYQPNNVHIELWTGKPLLLQEGGQSRMLAFSLVCRQMRSECIPVFYQVNNFVLHANLYDKPHTGEPWDAENVLWRRALRVWLDQTHYRVSNYISRLVIDIGTSFMTNRRPRGEWIWRYISGALALLNTERTTVHLTTSVLWRERPKNSFDLCIPLVNTEKARSVVQDALAIEKSKLNEWCLNMGVTAMDAGYLRMELETCRQELLNLVRLLDERI
jgi:hypothetical protein